MSRAEPYPELPPQLAASLRTEQCEQLRRQIKYHLDAPPYEEVYLSDVVALRLEILPGVTRPMSSKGLAKWLWSNSELYVGRRVLDVGTGCGIQGLTCLLGGARYAVLSDVAALSVDCARRNMRGAGEGLRGEVRLSDLFESLGDLGVFDLIVFAQPYFEGRPIPEYQFTRGMLQPAGLLDRFFEDASGYLGPGGRVALMGWVFAGTTHDPEVIGPRHGFHLVRKDLYRDSLGVQKGEFHVVLFGR